MTTEEILLDAQAQAKERKERIEQNAYLFMKCTLIAGEISRVLLLGAGLTAVVHFTIKFW